MSQQQILVSSPRPRDIIYDIERECIETYGDWVLATITVPIPTTIDEIQSSVECNGGTEPPATSGTLDFNNHVVLYAINEDGAVLENAYVMNADNANEKYISIRFGIYAAGKHVTITFTPGKTSTSSVTFNPFGTTHPIEHLGYTAPEE